MKTLSNLVFFFFALKAQSQNYMMYLPASNIPVAYSNHKVPTNHATINLSGKSSVTSNGVYHYELEIDKPKGVNNFTPNLTLDYNSSAGDNILGTGWSLSGLSMISRTNRNYYYDSKNSHVDFTSNDAFDLGGQRLQVKFGSNGGNGTEYELESENFISIKSFGSYNGQINSPEYFEILYNSGEKHTYGRYNRSTIANQANSAIYGWYLSRVEDINGNYIDYIYDKTTTNEVLIKSIKYGGNLIQGTSHIHEIEFWYKDKIPEVGNSKSYLTGNEIIKNKILNHINIYSNKIYVKSYSCAYSQDGINSYLSSIYTSNAAGTQAAYPMSFNYDYLKDQSTELTTNNVIADQEKSLVLYHDFDGDAVNDLIEVKFTDIKLGKSTDVLTKIMSGRDYQAPTILKAGSLNFFKNNIYSNSSKFSIKKSFNLNTSSSYQILNNQNLRFSQIDMDFDGISDLVMHEQVADFTFGGCRNVPEPGFKFGWNEDMYVYLKSHYFEYNKLTNDISSKILPNPSTPSLASLGYGNQTFQPRILTFNGSPFWVHRYFPSTFFVGDFDGDGYNDYLNCLQIGVDDNTNDYEAEGVCKDIKELISLLYISFPKNNSFNNRLDITFSGNKNFRDFCIGSSIIEVVEFNGNGISDLFVRKGNEVRIYEWDKNINDFIIIYSSSSFDAFVFEKTSLGDFNGDGKVDVLGYNNANNFSSEAKVYYSTGIDFKYGVSITKPVDKIETIEENKKLRILNYHPIVSDFNGDGISDIAIVKESTYRDYVCVDWREPVIGSNYCAKWDWRTQGYSYDIQVHYKSPSRFMAGYTVNIPRAEKPWGYHTTDIDGDNKADFSHRFMSNYGGSNQLKFILSNSNNADRVMTGVKNSFAEYENIKYRRLNATYNTYSFSNSQITDDKLIVFKSAPLNVVKEVYTQNSGFNDNVVTYSYYDLYFHRQGKGLLGFKRHQALNEYDEVTSSKAYWISSFSNYIPLIDEEKTTGKSGTNIISYGYSINKRNVSNKVIQILPSSIQREKITDNTQSVIETVYNTYSGSFDNLQSTYTSNSYWDPSTGIVEVKSSNIEFSNYVSNGSLYPNKAMDIITTNTDVVSGISQLKKTHIDYDAHGRIKTEWTNYTKPCEIKTEYEYDPFGNRTEVKQTALGQSPRVNKMIYDPLGLHVIKTINAQGQTESEITYNTKGEPHTKKDIRGIITEFKYDDWGRLTESRELGSGIYNKYKTEWGGSMRGGYYHTIIEDQHGTKKYNYFDIDGKLIMTHSKGRLGKDVYTHIEYDRKGRQVLTTKPYLITETPITEQRLFSSKNQLTSIINENGTHTFSYTYLPDKTITISTDPGGKTKTTIYDIIGRVIESKDNQNNVVRHTYNPADQLLTSKVNGDLYVRNDYDICGLMISQDDKSHGKTNFTYDVWGQLKSKKNARNQIERYDYDALGKTIKSTNPEGEVEYSYNTSGNGINMLAKVFIKGKSSKEDQYELINYDNKNRVIRHEKKIGGVSMSKSYRYNLRDQITQTSFSSGVSINYHYDVNGYLERITDNVGKQIYKVNDVSGLDQPKSYTLGNGITTINTYDGSYPQNFFSQNMLNSQVILDYNVNFDKSTGNVNDRRFSKSLFSFSSFSGWGWNMMTANFESFTYDNLDRLTEITTNGNIQNINYDDIGNIKDKYDVGEYINNDKNQVRAVTNDYGTISKNLQTITYTSFDQPHTLYENRNWLRYSYSANQQRFRAQYRKDPPTQISYNYNGFTSFYGLPLERLRYYFGDFEINCEVQGKTGLVDADYIHYVHGIDGKMVCVIRKPFKLDVNNAINALVTNPPFPIQHQTSSDALPIDIWYTPILSDHEYPWNPNFSFTSPTEYYYVYTDHIGSLLTFTDDAATVVLEQNFDAWGRYRDPNTLTHIPKASWMSFIYRGYTEHEHIDEFELINMNGRMYDPIIGKFLSTDAHIGDPTNSQSYNRYTYCLNNPLKYTDPSGEIIDPVSAFVVGFIVHGVQTLFTGEQYTVFGALNFATSYTINAIVTSAIGDFVEFQLPVKKMPVQNAVLSSIMHGTYNGLMAEAQGGSFIDGFKTSALSSVMGSAIHYGYSTLNLDPRSPIAKGIAILAGAAQGFIVDKYLNDGDGWKGAVTGAIIVGYNHFGIHTPEPDKDGSVSAEVQKRLDAFEEALKKHSKSISNLLDVSEAGAEYLGAQVELIADYLKLTIDIEYKYYLSAIEKSKILKNIAKASGWGGNVVAVMEVYWNVDDKLSGKISTGRFVFRITGNIAGYVAGRANPLYGTAVGMFFDYMEEAYDNIMDNIVPDINSMINSINNNNLYWLYGR